MKLKLGIVLLCAVFIFPAMIRAQVPVGRWEIVHTSGDSSAQTDLFPGGFSTFLTAGGSAYIAGTAAQSICVVDENSSNVVPTWVDLSGGNFQITIAIDNQGLGPNSTFIYTGAYNATTSVPADGSVHIPTITGTYVTNGDASACSTTTSTSSGTFIATFLPTLSSGSSTGSLDNSTADDGSPFDASVSTTVTYSAPPAPGQIAGTVSFGSSPTLNSNPCFAAPGGVVSPLIINSSLSSQSGIFEFIYADGFDPNGVPTTLILNGFSANLNNTGTNTDPDADQITSTEWASGAAIGEDDPGDGISGVATDGSNSAIVFFYDVVGGACNNAGGPDAPFFFVPGKPVHHRHKRHPHHRNKPTPVRDRGRDRRR